MVSDADLFSELSQIREVSASTLDEMQPFLEGAEPFIVRGLVAHWPLVKTGLVSGKAARDYLQSKSRDVPFVVAVAPPQTRGRIFYREDMSINATTGKAPLAEVFDHMDRVEDAPQQPTIYMGSVNMKLYFEGLREDNTIDFGNRDPIESIWIGTRSQIAAHNDFPDNLACVAVGERRFTVFPPSELRNLYIGPIDNTPAGRAISMVDFHDPDFAEFPRFRQALENGQTATLNPGDAIYIPSMWWHHVEGLSPFNVLVNYWWRETPRYLGGPQNALNHAIMTLRDLPVHERAYWRDMFNYYVFENGPDVTDHIPEHGRGVLAPMDAESAARVRSHLIRMLSDE